MYTNRRTRLTRVRVAQFRLHEIVRASVCVCVRERVCVRGAAAARADRRRGGAVAGAAVPSVARARHASRGPARAAISLLAPRRRRHHRTAESRHRRQRKKKKTRCWSRASEYETRACSTLTLRIKSRSSVRTKYTRVQYNRMRGDRRRTRCSDVFRETKSHANTRCFVTRKTRKLSSDGRTFRETRETLGFFFFSHVRSDDLVDDERLLNSVRTTRRGSDVSTLTGRELPAVPSPGFVFERPPNLLCSRRGEMRHGPRGRTYSLSG